MKSASVFTTLCVCATAVAVSGLWSGAGPLKPPAGPVQSTGVSLGEIGASLGALAAEPAVPVPAVGHRVFLTQLFVNGVAVAGEETTPLGGLGAEIFSFDQGATTPFDQTSGLATGRRVYEPIRFRKRIDKATPILQQALSNNQQISGVFEFYRPNPAGDGTTQHYFTIAIQGFIVNAHTRLVPSATNEPAPLQDVAVVFQTIRWTHEVGAVEHTDTWSSPI